MNIYINLFLQKNHSYTRHFSCLRQHWKQAAVLSIVRWFLLPDEPEKSCSAWNVRGESLEESRGRRALNTTSCQGFVCRVRGRASYPANTVSTVESSDTTSNQSPDRSVRTYWVDTEKYPNCFFLSLAAGFSFFLNLQTLHYLSLR